jgi:hypothetical protein
MEVITEFSAVNAPLNNNTRNKKQKNTKIVTRKGGNEITKDGIGKERINKHMHKLINVELEINTRDVHCRKRCISRHITDVAQKIKIITTL